MRTKPNDPAPRPWQPLRRHGTSSMGKPTFANSYYHVIFDRAPGDPPVYRLGITNLDQSARRDWREFQQIKNELVGPEAWGIEIFPPESQRVDPSNHFLLFVWREAPAALGLIGGAPRKVMPPESAPAPQREFAEGLDTDDAATDGPPQDRFGILPLEGRVMFMDSDGGLFARPYADGRPYQPVLVTATHRPDDVKPFQLDAEAEA